MSEIINKIRKHYFSGLNVPKESYSLHLLQDLLSDFGFIPVATSALAFQSINTVCNDVLYNQRKAIIEFGSGISTLVLANLIRKKRLECRLVSVENNAAWIDIQRENLKSAGLESVVEFLYAPSIQHPIALDGNIWYDMEPHRSTLEGTAFDSVIIDGPEAHQHQIRLSRYPALPFMLDYLNKDRHFILLDDAARPGEKEVRRRWKAQWGYDFDIKVATSRICIRGKFFNPVT